jgi:hypothetical protein
MYVSGWAKKASVQFTFWYDQKRPQTNIHFGMTKKGFAPM